MGIFNGRPDLLENPHLRDNSCPICTSKGYQEWNDDAGRASFDYICQQCNPDVVISLSDYVVGSTLLGEISKSAQRFELKEDIRNAPGNRYSVFTSTLDFFLGHAYKKQDIDDAFVKWTKGDLPGLPRLYENISFDELTRINEEQEKIFKAKVAARLSQLVNDYENRKMKSLNKGALLAKEIESVECLLNTDNIPHKGVGNEIIELGAIKLPLPLIHGIRSEYKNAVNGDTDINQIFKP
jgi:hypothetical protein